MNLDLRPLSLGELFDRAFTLYRRNLWLFVGVTSVPAVFALALAIIAQMMQQTTIAAAADGPDGPTTEDVLVMVSLLGGMMVVMLVYWVVYMVALGATTFAVSELYVGRSVTIGAVYGRMRGRVGRLLVLLLLIGGRVMLAAFGGLLMLGVVAGITSVAGGAVAAIVAAALLALGGIALGLYMIYLMLRYGLAVPALVIEGLPARAAARRSIELTRGRLTSVFLLGVCATMVTYAAVALFQGPFLFGAMLSPPDSSRAFWLNIIGAVSGTIASTFTTPFLIIGLALLYYDARIREEGFDLELTLAALDGQAELPRA